MPYLATPEALDNSTHSSSTSTQSRAKMNTPAPTPRTVPAICGERTDEPCTLLCLGLGAGQGVPLAPGSACFQHAPRVHEGGQIPKAQIHYEEFLMIGLLGLWEYLVSEALIGITHLESNISFW